MTFISTSAIGTRPETELLLWFARRCKDSERAEEIRALLQQDIDWTYLLQTALRHGMIPLLYWQLNATFPQDVPKVIMDKLRKYFNANALRNLFLTGVLLKLLNLLKAHGILAIPFKGPALASSVYGNLWLRTFSDLDILVHKQDVLRAKELLVSIGYLPEYRLTSAQEAAYLQSHCDYDFNRNYGYVRLEIHWNIIPRYFTLALDPECLWERLVPISLNGEEVLTLFPDDLLLILCIHGAKHLWERLGWICDVAQLIRVHHGIEWERVMELAGSLGIKRMFFLGLFLASNLLGATLPEEVMQRVEADPAVKRLAAQVRERLFRETHSLPGIFKRNIFLLKARERIGDRIRYCVHKAVTPNPADWSFLPLPASLFPLYYLLRPIRLARNYGLGALRQIYKGNKAR